MNQLLTLIYTVIASQSLLLAIVFFLKKDNKLANKILGLMFSLMTLSFSSAYLTYNHLPDVFQNLNSLWMPSLFLYAPLIYLYVMLLIKKISKITVKQSLRILPFVLFSILSLSEEITPRIGDLEFFHNIINGSTLTYYEFLLIQIGLIQIIIYELYLFKILKEYTYNIHAIFPTLTN